MYKRQVYDRGFRYYDFIDDPNHSMRSEIQLFDFQDSPERILLHLSEKAQIIGISATATLDTVVGNYDLEYLQRMLQDKYYVMPEADRCRLQESFQTFVANYDKVNIHVEPVSYNADDRVELSEIFNGNEALIKKYAEKLSISDVYKRQSRGNVILGEETYTLYGKGYITDYIGTISFQISPQSFYQVNPAQTEVLYNKALEYANLTGEETVWDLYCGIGTISLFLAQKAKKVYGVEIVPQAIADAKENALRNHISNAEFFVGKAEEVYPAYCAAHGEEARAEVIVVDPPRKGCEESLLAMMCEMAPQRIVYVSCDSATLARDLKYLCSHGYDLSLIHI